MASITSIISFLILLLATYSYSAPFQQAFETSTPEYEFTTGTTIVEHENSFNMHLISDDESTSVPHIYNTGPVEEVTTSDNVTFSTRSVQDFPSSSSDQSNEKRGLDEFSFTTMESSTEFNRRAIRPIEFQEEVETSTSFLSVNPIELTTNFEPSSSVDAFAISTGLLHNNETEETSTIFGYETYGQSTEESTTQFPVTTEELTTELPVTTEELTTQLPVTTQQLTKTVSIVPGRITETKIYLSVPTDQSVMVVNIGERGLKKGIVRKQPVVSTTAKTG
jgi:hypothetical protein